MNPQILPKAEGTEQKAPEYDADKPIDREFLGRNSTPGEAQQAQTVYDQKDLSFSKMLQACKAYLADLKTDEMQERYDDTMRKRNSLPRNLAKLNAYEAPTQDEVNGIKAKHDVDKPVKQSYDQEKIRFRRFFPNSMRPLPLLAPERKSLSFKHCMTT